MKKNIIIILLSSLLVVNFIKMNQQLTYPIDQKSIDALSKATDSFLYTKVFDLQWKKLFHYFTAFDSLDSLDITKSGAGGSVVYSNSGILISTDTTSTNYVNIQKHFTYQGLMTFSQPSNFRTAFSMSSTADVTAYFIVGYNTSNYYGFKVNNGTIYGVSSNSGTGNEVAVSLGSVSNNTEYNIEARYIPTQSVQFWVNSTQIATNTTGLPSSLVQISTSLFNIKVITNTSASKQVYMSFWEYLQRRNVLQ